MCNIVKLIKRSLEHKIKTDFFFTIDMFHVDEENQVVEFYVRSKLKISVETMNDDVIDYFEDEETWIVEIQYDDISDNEACVIADDICEYLANDFECDKDILCCAIKLADIEKENYDYEELKEITKQLINKFIKHLFEERKREYIEN